MFLQEHFTYVIVHTDLHGREYKLRLENEILVVLGLHLSPILFRNS